MVSSLSFKNVDVLYDRILPFLSTSIEISLGVIRIKRLFSCMYGPIHDTLWFDKKNDLQKVSQKKCKINKVFKIIIF